MKKTRNKYKVVAISLLLIILAALASILIRHSFLVWRDGGYLEVKDGNQIYDGKYEFQEIFEKSTAEYTKDEYILNIINNETGNNVTFRDGNSSIFASRRVDYGSVNYKLYEYNNDKYIILTESNMGSIGGHLFSVYKLKGDIAYNYGPGVLSCWIHKPKIAGQYITFKLAESCNSFSQTSNGEFVLDLNYIEN